MLRWFSTALAPGSREVVALAQPRAGDGEQPAHHLAAGGAPQAHRHIGGSESFVPAFPIEKQHPPGLTFPKLSFHWQKITAVHQTVLEEVAVPDGDGMHGLSQVKWGLCCGLTQDSWQFWQLTAGKWLICLLLPPLCLSVCLSVSGCKSFK